MKKIAIVGVDGSGKTVMMAAMGEQWERPDERGYFLSPENAEAFGFSKSVMAILRSGRWPNASSHDEMRHLDWSLQRRQGGSLEKIADISMLDYAGEVYRQAFGGEKREGYDEQVATLRSHVDEADVLIVLVNLSDIISGSLSDRRTRDAMWLTKSVLDYALEGKSRKPHAAIVFTQADSYREIISANGGPAGALKKYLPHVANLYGELPIFTASAIDHTVIGTDGLPVPAPGFRSTGLKELMDWMIDDCQNSVDEVRRIADEKRQRAIDLFREKRYDDAFEATRAAYRDGDDELAYQLAYMYHLGRGVSADDNESLKLCTAILSNVRCDRAIVEKIRSELVWTKIHLFEVIWFYTAGPVICFSLLAIVGVVLDLIIGFIVEIVFGVKHTDYPQKAIFTILSLVLPGVICPFVLFFMRKSKETFEGKVMKLIRKR